MKLSQKDLKKFFHPQSIAIVGASTGGFKLGGTSFMMKLLEGGYRGARYALRVARFENLIVYRVTRTTQHASLTPEA